MGTRLFRCPPILHPHTRKAAARSGHTSSLSFHPYCYFRPPANLFLSTLASSVLWVCFQPLTCARQKPPNSKKGRRKYVISSAHPPKTAVVLKEAHKERVVCMRVSCQGEHVCMSLYLWVSEQAWRESQSEGVRAGHSCSPPLLPPPPEASRLWWLVTPAGVINLQFPLHNQSRRAKVEELRNVKLSETSYKGSFGCCILSGGDTRTSGRGTRVPLVGTSDLLVSCLVSSQEVQQQFDSANHHTEDRSITWFAEQSEHRGPCSPESAQQVHTAWRLESEASLSGSKTSTKTSEKQSDIAKSTWVFLALRDTCGLLVRIPEK